MKKSKELTSNQILELAEEFREETNNFCTDLPFACLTPKRFKKLQKLEARWRAQRQVEKASEEAWKKEDAEYRIANPQWDIF